MSRPRDAVPGGSIDMVDAARRALAEKRALASALPAAFNSNFSIDILLMLYIDSGSDIPIRLDALGSAIGAPAPVAIRWATALEAIGLVLLAGTAASLAPAGRQAIERSLSNLVRGEQPAATSH